MSPEELMNSIGGISDRYIAEAAKKNCMKDFFCAGLIELAGGLIAGVFSYRKWSFTLLSLCLCLLLLGTKNIVKWARGNGCGTWPLVGKIILPVFWAFLILLTAILIGTRIRVITIGTRNIGLIEKPCENGSGSARRDILQSLKEKGFASAQILEISYFGSNGKGDYYLCRCTEDDGTEAIYYGFDEKDSRVRAYLLGEETIR